MCKGMNSTDLFDPDWTKPHSYQVDFYQFSLPPSPKFPFCLSVFHTCPLCSQCNKDSSEYCLDKEPRLSISIVIWILSSDTICQLNQFHTNSEAEMLSMHSHLKMALMFTISSGSTTHTPFYFLNPTYFKSFWCKSFVICSFSHTCEIKCKALKQCQLDR